jgi:hypothetical protein
MFTTESNIPIPNKPYDGATEYLKSIQVGESFLIKKSLRPGMHAIAKRLNIKITTKAENGMIRVWRKS